MAAERVAQCILGNGDCPKAGKLYDYSAEITAATGDNFDPVASRRMVIFGDAYFSKVNVVDVANVIARCKLEPKEIPTPGVK